MTLILCIFLFRHCTSNFISFESSVYLPYLYWNFEYMEYNYNNALMSLSANAKSVSVLGQFQSIVLFINGHALLLLCIPGNLWMSDTVNSDFVEYWIFLYSYSPWTLFWYTAKLYGNGLILSNLAFMMCLVGLEQNY